MEAVEAFLDGEWESLSNLFSCEESDLHLHFNGVSNNQDHSSFYSASQESDEDGSAYLQSMDFVGQNDAVMVPVFSDDLMEEILQLKAHMCSAESDQKLLEAGMEMQVKSSVSEEYNSSDQCRKKRPRACRNVRNTQSRKKKKACSDEEVNNAPTTSSACSSDEAGDSESVGKAKVVGKGPATDPQSLYARKRREKINERLKILQNLVPNGTKVDISTMLEEAVEYVKFLQLQIKLLSSDDLWMYAPIAYNGMDIGVYQKIVPNILG